MKLINLAHGAFAATGGYVSVLAATRLGVPFMLTLPIAFAASAAIGVVYERLLYRRLYRASHLDQVLFTIGMTYMFIAAATFLFGSGQQPVTLPLWLQGQWHAGGIDFGIYKVFLIGVVIVLTAGLELLIQRTRFGAQVRAAVDNQDVAAGIGIHVNRLFTLVFALGCGLAGLGGGLGIDVLGLDPVFPLKYLVYFLLVVTVGGAGSINGALIAALVLGVFDVAGTYYIPEVGAFIIYALMLVLLVLFPAGLRGKRG